MESVPGLTVVGGQAVNLWAITYCSEDDVLPAHGSHDLDVVAKGAVAKAISQLPDWNYKKTPLWSFDIRTAELTCKTEDGTLLAVEILNRVNGLDQKDLAATRTIEVGKAKFTVLDPIAMLKAKAANVRDLPQDGEPPRQDRQHLKIISICLPRFLEDAHSTCAKDEKLHEEMSKLMKRCFEMLFDKKNIKTLKACGITPSALIPDFSSSPIAAVKASFDNQFSRLKAAEAQV